MLHLDQGTKFSLIICEVKGAIQLILRDDCMYTTYTDVIYDEIGAFCSAKFQLSFQLCSPLRIIKFDQMESFAPVGKRNRIFGVEIVCLQI